jgi:hypothetical protein
MVPMQAQLSRPIKIQNIHGFPSAGVEKHKSIKSELDRFDDWYSPWQVVLRNHAPLCWVKDTRNNVVKKRGLESRSNINVRVIDSYLSPFSTEISLPVDLTLDQVVSFVNENILIGRKPNAILEIRREWFHDGLPDQELMAVTSDAFRVLYLMRNDLFRFILSDDLVPPEIVLQNPGPKFSMEMASLDHTIRVNPHTGELYKKNMTFIRVSHDEATAKEIRERYDITTVPRSSDPLTYARNLLPFALNMLVHDGHHISLIFLQDKQLDYHLMRVEAEDRLSKHALWHDIADIVAREGYLGFIYISEAWIKPFDETASDIDELLRQDPVGQCLIIHAESRDGRALRLVTPFVNSDGLITLKETNEEDTESAYFAEPVRDVWRGEQ